MRELTREEVVSIGLLSAEEYEKSKKLIPIYRGWWWLTTPGAYNNNTAYVFADGEVYPDGYFVYKEAGVRPALTISADAAATLAPGEPLLVGSNTATLIQGGKCLLDTCIVKHVFDEKSNHWPSSSLKAYMESDEFIQLLFGKKEQ